MIETEVAIYARVSSKEQAEANTIESQLAALYERIKKDGLRLRTEMEFIDDGYSGTTLVRPAMEKLRDLVAAGGVDKLYMYDPDRIARKYAYQVLLIEEFQRAGVEVIFLKGRIGDDPEAELLLQVQGMIAEYERAKIMERSRRGKLHAARSGRVSVLSAAPYGYNYINKHNGNGEARFEINMEEARVVRQVFQWIGEQRLTIGEVCRRLNKAQEITRKGRTWWDRTTIWGMLKNPAYKGTAAFGKTTVGPRRPRIRTPRGHSEQPRKHYSLYDVEMDKWIMVDIPVIISQELFDAVQEQLQENRQKARQGKRGAKYLLQGLVCCKICGHAYYGKPVYRSTEKGYFRSYAYYRCLGTDSHRYGGHKVCHNTPVRTDKLDEAVWQEVKNLLKNPKRIESEYWRRLKMPENGTSMDTLAGLEAQTGKLRLGLSKLIDSYAEGVIEKSEFDPRVKQIKDRLKKMEQQAKELRDEASLQRELHLIIGRLEDFAAKIKAGIENSDWPAKRDIIRSLVKRVEVDQNNVNVVFRISSVPFDLSPTRGFLQDCGRTVRSPCGLQVSLCTLQALRSMILLLRRYLVN